MTHKTDSLPFERAVFAYVAELQSTHPHAVVNSTHRTLRDLYKRFGQTATDSALARVWRAVNAGKTSVCLNWDDKENQAHYIFDVELNRIVGQLIPVDYELVSRSPGIQDWSKARAV